MIWTVATVPRVMDHGGLTAVLTVLLTMDLKPTGTGII